MQTNSTYNFQPKAGPMDTFWLIGPSGDTGEYDLMTYGIGLWHRAMALGHGIGLLYGYSCPPKGSLPNEFSGDSPRASNSAVTVGPPRTRED